MGTAIRWYSSHNAPHTYSKEVVPTEHTAEYLSPVGTRNNLFNDFVTVI